MDWKTVCLEMLDSYRSVFGNNHMFLLFVISLVYLWIFDREKRRSLVYPSVILILVVCNPVCYVYIWTRFLNYAYWRTFWILPVIPVLAYAMVHLIMHIREKSVSVMAGMICLLVLTQGAGHVYAYADTSFQKATNTYKLPQEAIDVCNALLELDPEPYAIVDGNLNCYVRQYTSRIHMLYGRDAAGYIERMDDDRREVLEILRRDTPDLVRLREIMHEMNYSYYARCNDKDIVIGEDDFREAGFEVARKVGNYTIYVTR